MPRHTRIRWAQRPQQDRNAWYLIIEGALYAALFNLTTPFFSMFALKMNASDYHLGLITALPGLLGILCLIPGSIIMESQRDSKSMVAILALLTVTFFPLMAFTPKLGDAAIYVFLLLVAGMHLPYQIFLISWQSFFSDVVAPARQNVVYARRQQVYTFICMLVVFFAGLGLSYLPKNEAQRMHIYEIYFCAAFLLGLAQVWVITRIKGYGTHTSDMQNTSGFAGARKALGESFRLLVTTKRFRSFTITSFIFHLSWHMGWTQFFLFAVNGLGTNEAWWSYMSVASSLASVLTFGFWNKFMTKRGSQITLVIGMLGLAMNPIMTAFVKQVWVLIPINLLLGLTFSGFQISLFRNMLDVVPAHNKTLNIALYTTILNVSAFMMPMVGVSFARFLSGLWPAHGQAAALFLTGIFRLSAGGLMLITVMRMKKEKDGGIDGAMAD